MIKCVTVAVVIMTQSKSAAKVRSYSRVLGIFTVVMIILLRAADLVKQTRLEMENQLRIEKMLDCVVGYPIFMLVDSIFDGVAVHIV